MSTETLHTCPSCSQGGFTERGLKAHMKTKRCLSQSPAKPAPKAKRPKPPTVHRSQPTEINPRLLTPAPELHQLIPTLQAVITHYEDSRKPQHREAAAELEQDLVALHASFDAHGILEPLKVTLAPDGKSGIIWDGRHRHQWAEDRDRPSVPIEHVTPEQGRAIIAATVAGRRHWTKGQKAWLAVQLHPHLVTGGKMGRPKKVSLSETFPSPQSPPSLLSQEKVASLFGVSPPLLAQAIEIAKAFARLPALRERHEPGIWAGHGLGAVLAGIPGAQATAQQPRPSSSWVSLTKPYGTLTTLGKAYTTWSPEDQQAAQDATVQWLRNDCAPEYRLMLTEALQAAAITV